MTLSDEQVDRLRCQVPDDLNALPVGHLACEVCGVAVPVDVFAEVIEPRKARRAPYTRCPDCRAQHQRTVELAADAAPAELVRVGRAVALAGVCTLLGVRSTLRSLAGQGPGAESSVAQLLGVLSRQEASELVVELLGDRVLLGGEDDRP